MIIIINTNGSTSSLVTVMLKYIYDYRPGGKRMKIVVLVGPSGTGKSYQAMALAKQKNISYIIDDGLLIKNNKVLGGLSAKREKSKMAAVKRALFIDEEHRNRIIEILRREKPDGILILGTSYKMVATIVKSLSLGSITERIDINDVVTEEEIKIARRHRSVEGKHVIPVPTFEIKKDFSGYFLNPLRVLRKFGKGGTHEVDEKSVVRPTFSYKGRYTISDRVIRDLILFASNKVIGVYKASNVDIKNTNSGIIIDMDVVVIYGNPIKSLMERLQEQIVDEVEGMTSLNIVAVNIFVKNLFVP